MFPTVTFHGFFMRDFFYIRDFPGLFNQPCFSFSFVILFLIPCEFSKIKLLTYLTQEKD